MARDTALATDDFNRAGPGLGANWAQLVGGTADMVIHGSTKVMGSLTGVARQAARWAGAGTFNNDHWASMVVSNLGLVGSTNYTIGVICRASADVDAARDYYEAAIRDTSPTQTVVLNKFVNGAGTVLATSVVAAFVNGDRLELEVEGTTLRLCKNGTALGGIYTLTDTSLSTGKPGISGSSDTNFMQGDDWQAGNFTAAAVGQPTMKRGRGVPGMRLGGTTFGQGF